MATNVTADQLVEKYQGDAVPTLPDYTKLVSEGFPSDGNPSTGMVATLPGAAWFALVSAMRISVIKAAGLTPAPTPDPLQFLTALQSMAWMQNKKITYSMLVDALTATGDKAKGLSANDCFLTPLSLKSVLDVICPAGMFAFFHATDVPEGWLLCNGAAVSRTTYARLFAKIGTKYGTGDGSTTFNLPNLNDRVLQGTTNTGSVGNYLEASLPNIEGVVTLYRASSGDSQLGAFYRNEGILNAYTNTYNGETSYSGELHFNAARSCNVYTGSALQPAACLSLVAIRY